MESYGIKNVRQAAADIRTQWETPWDQRYNIRSWEALYELDDGEIVAAILHERSDPGPTTGTRYAVSVTVGYIQTGSSSMALAGDEITAEEIATFLRVWEAAQLPVWKMREPKFAKAPLAVVRGTVPITKGHQN